ncbi:MAG: glycosyltransferase [Chitinophagaceae bacterium]|nr:glycosyltransferase [Chitinophagaceae bacterium]
MKLVLAGRLAWKYESFTKSLETYKYKSDVIMTGYISEEELVKLTGAAYAMVYPSLFEGFGVPVLEAMQSDVPVITSAGSAMQEITNDAALLVNPDDFNDIAEKMMLIYKDENLKKRLVEKGKKVVVLYNWDRTANLLWHNIMKCL